jgi:hypothetical protein
MSPRRRSPCRRRSYDRNRGYYSDEDEEDSERRRRRAQRLDRAADRAAAGWFGAATRDATGRFPERLGEDGLRNGRRDRRDTSGDYQSYYGYDARTDGMTEGASETLPTGYRQSSPRARKEYMGHHETEIVKVTYRKQGHHEDLHVI